MGSIYRSEFMSLCQLFLSSEAAYNCISELGEIGLAEFRDLNPNVNPFQRKFVHEVRRCEEMERKLMYLERELGKDDIKITNNKDYPEAPQPREMIDLEATFEKLENELKEVNSNAETLKQNFLELTELKHVLMASQSFFTEESEPSSQITQNLIPEEGGANVQLGFVSGVISRERMPAFERMLWRVCRGNAFLRQQEIDVELEDPTTGENLNKVVFLIFFQGERLKSKVKKICEGCRSTLYPCPETFSERKEMLEGVKTRIDDLSTILNQTTDHRHRVLVAAAKHLRTWFIKVRKMKGIYHILNMLNYDVTTRCLIAEAWIPVDDISIIKVALEKGTERSGSAVQPILTSMETKLLHPTFYRTNKFSRGYQNLIDAYRIGTYREINPGLYTCATFPFLFAVMFGDFGHGFIMALFGLWMILWEKKLIAMNSKNEIWNMFFSGRYIILMMGFSAVYTGLIYNDIFSKSWNIFQSNFHIGNTSKEAILRNDEEEWMLDPGDPEDYEGEPYPFGMDPMWQISINKINFWNSYKMKLSIIIGVTHMMAGIILSLLNHIYFRRTINIIFEFIPQVIFLMSLFGYLCFLIFYKWVNYGCGDDFDDDHNSHCAPSILILFIDMMLLKTEEEKDGCPGYMFDAQEWLQKLLVVIAVIMVPLMLLPKPFILKHRHKKKMEALQATSQVNLTSSMEDSTAIDMDGSPGTSKAKKDGTVDQGGGHGVHEEVEEFDFGDVFIIQIIHTIEYVLGCVSHTASYLRLWALSLAHEQLSEVLWAMVLRIGLIAESTVGSIGLYLLFAAWAFFTISILVVMEGLSAFLHTLRLHWVEFCSKFFEGEGELFAPFYFLHFTDPEDE